jgi:hypothetical protein
MNTELQRLHELAVGQHWVNDSQELLYCCLTNVDPTRSHLAKFEGIPPSYLEAVKLLYRAVGQSDAEELKSPQAYDMAAERICGACLTYLQKESLLRSLKTLRRERQSENLRASWRRLFRC